VRIKIILMSMCATFMFLGCAPSVEEIRDAAWEKVPGSGPRDPGPHTFKLRKPLQLADGSRVVCVATYEMVWCKEAAQ